jgi:Uma2 family endonuclease
VLEVLSPSTEEKDKGEKKEEYLQISSLREYILISQDQVRVEQHIRDGETWIVRIYTRLEDVITLLKEVHLQLKQIYEGVKTDKKE